jgi:hypothetical protein
MKLSTNPEEQELGIDLEAQNAAPMPTRPGLCLASNHDTREIPDSEDSSPLESPLENEQPVLENLNAIKAVTKVLAPTIHQAVTSKDASTTLFSEAVYFAMQPKTIEQQIGISDHAKTRYDALQEIPDTDSEDEDVTLDDVPIAELSRVRNEANNENPTSTRGSQRQRNHTPQNAITEGQVSTNSYIHRAEKSMRFGSSHDFLQDVSELDVEKPVTNPSVSMEDAPAVLAVHTQRERTGEELSQSTLEAQLSQVEIPSPTSTMTDSSTVIGQQMKPIAGSPVPESESSPLTLEQNRLVCHLAQDLHTSYKFAHSESTERSPDPPESSSIPSQRP